MAGAGEIMGYQRILRAYISSCIGVRQGWSVKIRPTSQRVAARDAY